jgi:hypothetical protein
MPPMSGPGIVVASGAGLVQAHPSVVESPLPGGVAAVVRFLLQTVPQWVQIGGVFVGAAVAAWVLVYLWRRRVLVRQWIVTRQRRIQYALAAAAAVLVLGAAAFGRVSWNYMQHDNGFCTGCHVMGPAYRRFLQSEHDTLSCHDCHQQSIFASMRQLYFWVSERPQRIGPHAKVPNGVCARCHVTGQRQVWQHIAQTAGHRTHLESDSSALRNVQCVTCHGAEVHHFAPLDSTCAQAGCHVNVPIKLGKMRQQTSLHCVTCHQFTAEVPRLATRDSATGTLRPAMKQCFSCHEMRAVLADFDPARDPHRGTCGMCHNPHTQERPADAKLTCTTARCHADWRGEPFHTGLRHRNVATQCTLCHAPHHARVDASDCTGCHAAVRERLRGRPAPPLQFDTTKALRRGVATRDATPRGKGDAQLPFDEPPPQRLSAAAPDTFPHDRHKQLACLTCHASQREHARLTFQPPRGCQICHHQAPDSSTCATCHSPEETAVARPESVRVTVVGHAPRLRDVVFRHETHRAVRCVACHSTPVSLAAGAPVTACTACHDDHHTAARDCAACHAAGVTNVAVHAPPVEAHEACDACHATATVARLVPDRSLCLTCHAAQRDHYSARECTTCHFQATPEEYRAHLRRPSDRRGS